MKKRIGAGHGGARRLVRIVSLLGCGIVAFGVTLVYAFSSSSGTTDKQGKKGKAKASPGAGTAFTGGTFEASGVAFVPGADGVLFVGDSRPDAVFWMKIDQAGQQVGEITPVSIGAIVENPEAITFDGTYFYIVGSQSNPKMGERNSIARFAFDPEKKSVKNTSLIGNLRELLLSKVPDLKGAGEKKGSEGGLNIEGLAWDPVRKRLLFGLRSPITNGQALIVPMKLTNPDGPFSAENLHLDDAGVIQLSLAGSGIRDIQYDNKLKSFFVISGAPENQVKGDFILWQWNGDSQPQKKKVLDQTVKPEGITGVEVAGQSFIFIVCDASRYMKLDYEN